MGLLAAGVLSAAALSPIGDATADESAKPAISLEKIAAYNSGAGFENGGTEIVVYNGKNKRAYSTNSHDKAIDILDMTTLGTDAEIAKVDQIKISDFYIDDFTPDGITSVAIHPSGGYIAAAVPASPRTDNGKVVFMDLDGTPLGSVTVGALPDMLTFTPDGKQLLVANEGEPAADYSVDPEGSVSIINMVNSAGEAKMAVDLTDEDVVTAGFGAVDMPEDVRTFHGLPAGLPGVEPSTAAQHMEPEFITVSGDNKFAYVSLQENNAIGVLDLTTQAFTKVHALGFKDHSLPGNGMDVTDKDEAINIGQVPFLGMYMPDGISMIEHAGKSYILTANEGDAREYIYEQDGEDVEAYVEAVRVEKLASSLALDAKYYKGFTQEQLDELADSGAFAKNGAFSRLNVTTVSGKNADGKYDRLYAFGARSFSIWDAETGQQVYDSGDDFEQITAELLPEYFNISNSNNTMDNRSDDKGPEPEYVEVGKVGDKTFAFIGLERISGIMVYDITNPLQPKYETFISSRVFAGDVEKNEAGDVAPEGLKFVPASESQTGKPLLLTANEVSGTIAVYEITAEGTTPGPSPTASPANPSTPDPVVTVTPTPSASPSASPAPSDKPRAVEVTEQEIAKQLNELPAGVNELVIDAGKLEQSGVAVTLPASLKAAGATNSELIITIAGDSASYELPLAAIQWQEISSALGTEQFSLRLEMKPVHATEAGAITAAAAELGAKQLGTAMDYSLVAVSATGATHSIHSFGNVYVERSLKLPGQIDSEFSTVVRYDGVTGKLYFVPSVFRNEAGAGAEATIKRNGNSVYAVVSGERSFTDVETHWAKGAINSLASKLIVSGVNEEQFAPQAEITRAEFAALVVRSLGLAEAQSAASFTDVSSGKWYASAVETAAAAGLVKGYTDGSFRPEATISRQELAVMLQRAMAYTGQTQGASDTAAKFADALSIAAWAKPAVSGAVDAAIVEGLPDGRFAPEQQATRAEAVVMLQRMLKHLVFIN
jgi:hypothetical protein